MCWGFSNHVPLGGRVEMLCVSDTFVVFALLWIPIPLFTVVLLFLDGRGRRSGVSGLY